MKAATQRHRTRLLVLTGVAAGLLLFFGANAHLVYVAIQAQSECVDHLKMPDETRPGQFRAAKSAC